MTQPAGRTPGFLFIRHGETDWNAEGRLQGQRDIPLNELGRRQAHQAGLQLGKLIGQHGAAPRFVVSPLGRTRETAERVGAAIGRAAAEPFRFDDRLKEFSFGTWEGLTWPEVRLREAELLRSRRRDKWRFEPPGGESYAMLAERVRPWLATVTEGTVAVSHGGVARVLMVLVGGLSIAAAPNTAVIQGRVLRFEDGRFTWT